MSWPKCTRVFLVCSLWASCDRWLGAAGHPEEARPGRTANPALTPQPLWGVVLQQGERDAEKSDQQVAASQGADEDVGGHPHGFPSDDDVAQKSQQEDEEVEDQEDDLGVGRQLGDVDQGLQPVGGYELLPAHVVLPQEPGESLRGHV